MSDQDPSIQNRGDSPETSDQLKASGPQGSSIRWCVEATTLAICRGIVTVEDVNADVIRCGDETVAYVPTDYDAEKQHVRAWAISAVPEMVEALEAYERLDQQHANCPDCDGELQPELCETCFPFADDARLKMRAALEKSRGAAQ